MIHKSNEAKPKTNMYQTMHQTLPQHEMIIDTDLRCVSADESSVSSMSTASSDDSSCESLYELDISRLLTFQRMEYSSSIGSRVSFDCDCSDITEQEYSMEESFCDIDELSVIRAVVTKEAEPSQPLSNLEISQRMNNWRKLQVVGVCVGIPSLLLLLDPSTGRSTRH